MEGQVEDGAFLYAPGEVEMAEFSSSQHGPTQCPFLPQICLVSSLCSFRLRVVMAATVVSPGETPRPLMVSPSLSHTLTESLF